MDRVIGRLRSWGVVAIGDLVRRPPGQVPGARWAPVIAVTCLGLGPVVYLLGGRRR